MLIECNNYLLENLKKGKQSMKTYEQIVEEVIEEILNPDTSSPTTLDTRTLLVKTAALTITAIESLDTDREEAETDDDIIKKIREGIQG